MRELGEAAPPKSLEERLTEQFYRWERRGRGWKTWPHPVALEPPFRPFFGHFLTSDYQSVDDGRKHTFLSSLVERLAGGASSSRQLAEPEQDFEAEPEPDASTDEDLVEIEVVPGEKFVAEQHLSERFPLALSSQSSPIAFGCLAERRAPGWCSLHGEAMKASFVSR